ncbi:MAG: hypothetical protein C0P74_015385 [Gammaproteobacteria bacterium]
MATPEDQMQQGFFRRAGGRLSDFFGNVGSALGDAFGVTAAGERGYMQGLEERSRRDLAMEQARKAREEARRLEAERMARSNLGYSLSRALGLPLYDAEAFADIMRAGYADFRGITGGRGDIQTHQFRGTVADPATDDDTRLATLEALAPGQAVTQRLSAMLRPGADGEPLEIVVDPETGQSVYVPRSSAVGMRPAARPSGAASGGLKASDTNAIYRQVVGLFEGATWDPITGRIAGLSKEQAAQAQRIASRASQLYASGQVLDHATAVDIALQEMRAGGIPAPRLSDDLTPAGVDPYEGITATGPNGEKVVWRGGRWVPLE